MMILIPVNANSAKSDLSKMTCKTFVGVSEDQQNTIVAWLSGFNAGDDDPKIVDTDQLDDVADALVEFCTKNPTTLLQDVK